MKKPQLITAAIAVFLVIAIFAATQKNIFGPPKHDAPGAAAVMNTSSLSIDSILFHAKEKLSPEQINRIGFLEHSVSRGDVMEQQLHIYHQLAGFWRDSARKFEPFAWYTAEAARLENSEKSLTFAARLFLQRIEAEDNQEVRQWEAFQAKDLFERSLKLNPANDSSRVELGTVLLYGGIASPMEGIGMIRAVADKDSNNVYAQLTLADASFRSGQMDKAIERFKKVVRMEPSNLRAIFGIAETAEQMGNKEEAIEWYQKSLPFITMPEMKDEVEARIARLKK
jgi:tetratricopeptide (TPR) repeat protein